jgi:hypothetical protein
LMTWETAYEMRPPYSSAFGNGYWLWIGWVWLCCLKATGNLPFQVFPFDFSRGEFLILHQRAPTVLLH